MKINELTPQQRTYILGSGIYSIRNDDIYDDISDVVATEDGIGDRMARNQYL
jgi:hypothetical protein